MSLVGSLEDLGLGDILQIVSLARKSGRLVLRTDGEAGWIILCDGQVRGAAIKGQSDDLRGLIVGSGEVAAETFDAVRDRAVERNQAVNVALVEEGALSAERLDALRRERVERSVMNMFLWRTGEFSFEVRDGVDAQEEELLLSSGINTQYLAMEATRLRDEGELLGPPDLPDEEPMFSGEDAAPSEPAPAEPVPVEPEPAATPEVSSEPVPATEASEPPPEAPFAFATEAAPEAATPVADPAPAEEMRDDAAVEAMAMASVRGVEASETGPDAAETNAHRSASPSEDAPSAPATSVAADAPSAPATSVAAETPAPAPAPPAQAAPGEMPPLVALDGDLVGLEWLKAQAGTRFPRVHIFQTAELAMDRVRRYLVRNVAPLVVASPDMLRQQDAGRDLLTRLRSLAPGMVVLGIVNERAGTQPEGVDGCLTRPVGLGSDPESWNVHAERAGELVAHMVEAVRHRSGPGGSRRPDAALESLRSVSDRLRDPDRRDDVLTVVLEFAARSLSRVAMFMLRDDEVIGMAEIGLSRTGGPDEEAMRSWVLDRRELPELFVQALTSRRGVRGSLAPGRDGELLDRLGGQLPVESYVAPIESGGSPVALVYGDNLPQGAPIGDTTALEIVLHEAGLALDRASLELALAAAQGGSGG